MHAHLNQPPAEELRRVKAHAKRRCPHCHSPKWDWIGAEPVTLVELEHHLLVRYRCRLCGQEFLVEEAKRARVVAKAERCVHCDSDAVERTSRPGADAEIWRCRRCNAYMMVTQEDATTRPLGLVLQEPVRRTDNHQKEGSKVS
jgi:ribosomal protein L37AE/L43A